MDYIDNNLQLDEEEKEILEAFEQGKLKRVPDFEAEKAKLEAAARATLEKTKNVNIRISAGDLYKVKSMAQERGIAYQTLLTSLIHQYSRGLIDYNILREPRAPYQTYKPKTPKKSGKI
jgi:predicted DNA binding CopG/RHH family protein